jgi:hypothetical protein
MPHYPVGPGHHAHSLNAIVETYVDTDALEVLCPNCHAKPGAFCRHESGLDRRMPCPRRIQAAKAVKEGR